MSKGDPAVKYNISHFQQPTHTASSNSFRVAKNWIQVCREQHDCGNRRPFLLGSKDLLSSVPSRLIDLRPADISHPDARLVNMSDLDDPREQYVTLSHCWGGSLEFKAISSNILQLQEQIIYDSLPRTFRDAIVIARGMGVRYLWIDALCILQDSFEDWSRESRNMGQIYMNALFTIAASASQDGDGGCFNKRSTSQEELLEIAATITNTLSSGVKSCLYIWAPKEKVADGREFDAIATHVDHSPLAHRGWVLQERILSPRTLHYTQMQLFWECRHTYAAEDGLRTWLPTRQSTSNLIVGFTEDNEGPGSFNSAWRGLSVKQINLIGHWYQEIISRNYSGRLLTVSKDKLTAVSSLARLMATQISEYEYVTGIWLIRGTQQAVSSFGLAWRCPRTTVRCQEYRAPSFSWASVDGYVIWPDFDEFNTQDYTLPVVPRYNVELEGGELNGDTFGRIASATVFLEGKIFIARISPEFREGCPEIVNECYHPVSNEEKTQLRVWSLLDASWIGDAYVDSDAEPGLVLCLQLGSMLFATHATITVLLLVSVDNVKREENVYRRVGVGRIPVSLTGSKVDPSSWEKETIAIM